MSLHIYSQTVTWIGPPDTTFPAYTVGDVGVLPGFRRFAHAVLPWHASASAAWLRILIMVFSSRHSRAAVSSAAGRKFSQPQYQPCSDCAQNLRNIGKSPMQSPIKLSRSHRSTCEPATKSMKHWQIISLRLQGMSTRIQFLYAC